MVDAEVKSVLHRLLESCVYPKIYHFHLFLVELWCHVTFESSDTQHVL